MLPGIDHDQQEQERQRAGELRHFAAALGIGDAHQARVVDGLGEVDLGRAAPTASTGPYLRTCCGPGCHYATPLIIGGESAGG